MNTQYKITLLLILISALSLSCSKKDNGKVTVAETPAILVQTANVEIGTITSWHKTTAELRAPLVAVLSFTTGGTILELKASQGDFVSAGQILGRVDTSTLQAQYDAAKSGEASARSQAQAADIAASAVQTQVEQARLGLEQAQRDFDRFTSLHNDKVATDAEYERISLALKQAELNLQAATEAYESAKAQAQAAWKGVDASGKQAASISSMISDGTLRAPFSGRISIRYLDPGNMAAPGSPVFKLVGENPANPGQIEIRYKLPELLVSSIEVGMPVFLALISCDSEIETKIASIGAEINSNSRTVEVVSYMSSGENCFLPGMFGTIRIPETVHENVMILPEDAVLELTTEKVVYIAQGDTAVRKKVTTGIRDSGKVEIIDGISKDDIIIVKGNSFLADGAKIQIDGSAPTETPDAESEQEQEASN